MKSISQILNGPLGNLKYLGAVGTEAMPKVWIILWVNRTSEVGSFHGLINISPPILIYKHYHFVSGTMV